MYTHVCVSSRDCFCLAFLVILLFATANHYDGFRDSILSFSPIVVFVASDRITRGLTRKRICIAPFARHRKNKRKRYEEKNVTEGWRLGAKLTATINNRVNCACIKFLTGNVAFGFVRSYARVHILHVTCHCAKFGRALLCRNGWPPRGPSGGGSDREKGPANARTWFA